MNSQHSFDAIVIGAGPAGATAAYIMASHGQKVLLIDQHMFPRDKLCGGLLTRKTLRLLETIFQTTPNELKSQGLIRFRSWKYTVNNYLGESIRGRLDYPFHFIERRSYDLFWLNMAQAAGAEFKAGEKVVVIDPYESRIKTNKGNIYHGRFIIGADGVFSKIRTRLIKKGLIRDTRYLGLGTALEIVIPKDEAPRLPDHPIVSYGYIPWGYAWSFPRRRVRVIGICALNIKAGRQLKDGFYRFLDSNGIAQSKAAEPIGHALPFGSYLDIPGFRNILLVGDACGLADPFLGEGIYYAHKSAQLASSAVIDSSHHPNSALEKYRQQLHQKIIVELKYANIGRQIIFSLPGNWPYKVLPMLLKLMPRICAETIQGQRTFKWLRRVNREFAQKELSAR
ncbi:MAG: geranylgeranyl reductase family protein [Desulfobacterales bacterium]|jgi:geranylgeranyl reductase family protein